MQSHVLREGRLGSEAGRWTVERAWRRVVST